MITRIKDVIQGKHPTTAKRSGKWPSVRKTHLEAHPTCELCGGTKKLNVHHIKPFHLHPELELDPSNLITLCEEDRGGVNCHLFFGHLGNFRTGVNPDVRQDVESWTNRIVFKEKSNDR